MVLPGPLEALAERIQRGPRMIPLITGMTECVLVFEHEIGGQMAPPCSNVIYL